MIAKIIRLSRRYINNLKWTFIDFAWKLKPNPTSQNITNNLYSIGVVTYVKRYEIHFLPLIKRLITIFPDTQIVIAVNGYYDNEVQKEYLNKILPLLSSFKNVSYVTYDTGQSLSKLWNQLIIRSNTNKSFIFNDDIKISSCFRNRIEQSGILNNKCGLINSSWSHFLLSKEIVKETGWFDERFPGVGYEDHDYEMRLAMNGIIIKDFNIKGIKNIVFMTTDFSYGKDIDVENKKYSGDNGVIFSKKWKISEKEEPDFIYVRIARGYAQLRLGMETPNFYPDFK